MVLRSKKRGFIVNFDLYQKMLNLFIYLSNTAKNHINYFIIMYNGEIIGLNSEIITQNYDGI